MTPPRQVEPSNRFLNDLETLVSMLMAPAPLLVQMSPPFSGTKDSFVAGEAVAQIAASTAKMGARSLASPSTAAALRGISKGVSTGVLVAGLCVAYAPASGKKSWLDSISDGLKSFLDSASQWVP